MISRRGRVPGIPNRFGSWAYLRSQWIEGVAKIGCLGILDFPSLECNIEKDGTAKNETERNHEIRSHRDSSATVDLAGNQFGS